MTLLGDLIAPAPLRRAGTEELPILSMTMHEGLVDQAEKFKKRVASADTSPYKRVLYGQLVVGFPIDEGVLSFQTMYEEAIVSPAYDIWNVLNPDAVCTDYLERFLRSGKSLQFYKAKLRGTTARRRTLPDDIFLQLEVPLPSIIEQKRIVAILEKADSLRRKRQQAIRLADDFLRAVFLDMFGDPIGNDGNRVSLAKVIDIDAPMVDPRLDDYADMLHVGPDRIEKDTGRLLECQTACEEGLISKKFLFDDSYVLYSKIRPYLRKCALATFTGLCSADMYPVRPKVGVATREFVWALLLSNEFDRYVASLPDRANIPKLNRDELNAFEFNLPPIQKQEKFSAIVQKRIAYTNLLDSSSFNALRLANSLQAHFL